MVKKEDVYNAVLRASQPVTGTELWNNYADTFGWKGTGETPQRTLSKDLGELCREGKLRRVKVDRGYAYCQPGKCGGEELTCAPLNKRVGSKKAQKNAPKKAPKKAQKAPKPVIKKQTAAKPKKSSTVSKKPTSAAMQQDEQPDFADGNFDGNPQEEEEEQPFVSAAKPKKVAKQRKTATKRKGNVRNSFANYIAKSYQKVRPGQKISRKAVSAVDSIIIQQVEKIAEVSQKLLSSNKQSTLNPRTVQHAMKVVYNPDLAKHMISESVKAVTTLNANESKKKTTRSNKAELILPASRVRRLLHRLRAAPRYGANVDVYLTGAMDYLTQEILDIAANTMKDRKKKMLTPRDLLLTVKGDEDLNAAIKGTFGSGGVVPQKK